MVTTSAREAPPHPGPTSARELLRLVREDHRVNSEGLWTPGFYAVAVHRFGGWVHSPGFPRVVRAPARAVYDLLFLVVRNIFGIQLPWTVRLGRRVRFAHQHGIVIHPWASFGDDCIVRQGVTVGAGTDDPATFRDQAPQVGHRVSLGAGCVVVGRVTIGDDAVIGPNTVVMTHVPAGAMVLAQPPRIVRRG